MVEKFIFSMQIIFIGFSVVMVVLIALYGLTVLFNRLASRLWQKEEQKKSSEVPVEERLPPQLVAAITAAVNFHQAADSGRAGPAPLRASPPEISGSRWVDAGRKALLENNLQLERSRRKWT